MRTDPNQLENLAEAGQDKKVSRKEKLVDIAGNITYSFIVGAGVDCAAGLNFRGIAISRTYATGMNCIVGAPYGMWRNYVFKKKEQICGSGPARYISKIIKKRMPSEKLWKLGRKLTNTTAELFAFNTFQAPLYGLGVAVATLISEGGVNWEKVMGGTRNVALLSPFFGLTLGWYLDKFRNFFGIKSAPDQAKDPASQT
ncbi:MAG: L-alanine exporter AlaE [archaeon]